MAGEPEGGVVQLSTNSGRLNRDAAGLWSQRNTRAPRRGGRTDSKTGLPPAFLAEIASPLGRSLRLLSRTCLARQTSKGLAEDSL